MLVQTTYESIRNRMRSGDGMSTGAGGFVSSFIKYWSRPKFWRFWDWSSLSHSLQVFTVDPVMAQWLVDQGYLKPPAVDRPGDRNIVIESTTLSGKSGVQVNWASERIANYDGRVYWHPLDPVKRAIMNMDAYTAFGLKTIGLPYDTMLIVHHLLDRFRLIPSREDWNAFDCVEHGAALYKVSGVLPANVNSSDLTPQSMAELKLWAGCYQLKGAKKEIRNFNTRIV